MDLFAEKRRSNDAVRHCLAQMLAPDVHWLRAPEPSPERAAIRTPNYVAAGSRAVPSSP